MKATRTIIAASVVSASMFSIVAKGNSVSVKELTSDVDLFNYLKNKKFSRSCSVDASWRDSTLKEKEPIAFEKIYSYNLKAQKPGTAGNSMYDWDDIFISSNFKMNFNVGKLAFANTMTVTREASGSESLEFVIHEKNVTDTDYVFAGPLAIPTGGKVSVSRFSGRFVFNSQGVLESMAAQHDFLGDRLSEISWETSNSIECGQ